MKRIIFAAVVAAILASSVAKVEAFCLWDYCLDCGWYFCWGE